MSQWCELYVGDRDVVAGMLTERDTGELAAHETFEDVLHGGPAPGDEWILEALTRLAAQRRGRPEVALDVEGGEQLLDDEDAEAFGPAWVLPEAWVKLMAKIEAGEYQELTLALVRRLSLQTDEQSVAGLVEYVRVIVETCRTALNLELTLVYTWSG